MIKRLGIASIKKIIQVLVEITFFLPVLLLLSVYLLRPPSLISYLFVIIIYYVSGMIIRKGLGSIATIYYILLGCGIIGLINLLLFDLDFFSIFRFVIGVFLYYRGLRYVEVPWEEVFPSSLYMIGIIIYLSTFILFFMVEELKAYLIIVQVMGVPTLVFGLFQTNGLELKSIISTGDSDLRVPKSIMKYNYLLTFIGFIIITVIASINYIGVFVRWIVTQIGRAIFFFMEFFADILNSNVPIDEGGGLIGEATDEIIREPSMVEKVIEVLITILVYVGILLLTYYVIKYTIRMSKGLIIYLKGLMKQRSTKDSKPYYFEDQKEIIMDWKKLRKQYYDKVKDWINRRLSREPKWENIKTNKEKVRYLYRHWLYHCIKSGYKFKPHLTPEEVLEDIDKQLVNQKKKDLIHIYNEARYSNHTLSDEHIKNEL